MHTRILLSAVLSAALFGSVAARADDLITAQNPQQTPLQKCMHECGRQAIGKSKSCKDPDDEAQVECLGKERVAMHHCYDKCKKTNKTSS